LCKLDLSIEEQKMLANSRLRTIGEYAAGVALCLVILVFVINLWKANLRVPFEYGGDALFHGMVIKGIIDNGWYLSNNFIGAPGGAEVFYFPMADNLHFLLIKLFSLFTNDYALIFNLYFLLTFPLTTISSLYVFRHFKISYLIALLGSQLYTFLPYHFFRNEHHLVLAGYYIVPLMVMVLIWVFSGRLLTSGGDIQTSGRRLNLHRRRFIASILICLLIASGGLGYYAFFGCFFLLVAGVTATLYWNSVRHLVVSLILIVVVFSGFVTNLIPNMIYTWRQGESRTVQRGTGEAEAYGLKIAQMLLPIDGHRIPALARLKHRYNSEAPLVNDNTCASLGAMGSIGFLTLLGWLFFWKPTAKQIGDGNETRSLLSHLSLLNIGGVLLATVGGFSSLFAVLISPQIRSYNRVSVYLSFFSLFAVVLLLENFFRRRARSGRARIIFAVSLGVLLLIGILDQTGKGIYFIPAYAAFGTENASDVDFIARIEATVPTGSMIFQLPYVPFPENGPVYQMPDYEHFRAYLNSKNLRWSYGAIKDRDTARWQMSSAALPPDRFLEAISIAGFSGVYLDRGGYADNGADMEAKLRSLLAVEPIISPNMRMSFFDLGAYNTKLAERYGGKLPTQREMVMNPLTPEWTKGFASLEGAADLNWRWGASEGELVINNTLSYERRVKLEMALATGYEESANLSLDGDLISEQLKINLKPTDYSKIISIPPGRHVIRFKCDAKLVYAPADGRPLVFKVNNFRLQELN
jgi:phosphoglycerol transferase